MSERGWAVVAGCLAVACGLTAWAWIGERETHRVTRIELAKAAARLSAQVPADPAASPRRAAARPAPDPDDSGEIEDLSARLAAAEREREEYRQGLEQAVAELNRQKGKHQAELAAARALGGPSPAPSTAATRPRGKVVPLLDPELTPLGDQIMVSGKVYNVGDSDTEVTCALELLRDGQRIDSARFLVRVSAGATQPYSHKFPFRPGIQGSYSARLSIE